jgi:hypothetical protein
MVTIDRFEEFNNKVNKGYRNVLNYLIKNDIKTWDDFQQLNQKYKTIVNNLIDVYVHKYEDVKDVVFLVRVGLSNKEQLEEYLNELEQKEEYEKCKIILDKLSELDDIKESIDYHIKNNISFFNNVFRPYSKSYFKVHRMCRILYENNDIKLNEEDKYYFDNFDIGKLGYYEGVLVPLDIPFVDIEDINEKTGEYKGREVELEKPKRNTSKKGKKYYVYVKNPETKNVNKINFGDEKGGLTAKVNDPDARRDFVNRHNCKDKKDKMKPGYWSCNLPKFKNLVKTDYNGYW